MGYPSLISTFGEVFLEIDRWFEAGAKFFEFTPGFEPTCLTHYAEKLAYHNNQIWHYEDCGRSMDDALVVLGWRGAQQNNTARNDTINAIDAILRPEYRDEAELHSETVGSLFDRITIQDLKYKNFLEKKPETAVRPRSYITDLIECTQVLLDDIHAGRKRCLELPRLKLYFDSQAER